MAFEFHGGSLTETVDDAVRVLRNVDRPNMGVYWQYHPGAIHGDGVGTLKAVLPWLIRLHVNYWGPSGVGVLADAAAEWREYLDLAATTGREHYALIEFVKDNDVEQFRNDATTLATLPPR